MLGSCCIFLLLLFTGSFADENARIIGGEIVSISTAQYMMQVYINGQFSCGGSLIKGNVVVTAGHCGKGVLAKQMTVKGGATHLTDPGVKRGVKQIILPTAYKESTLNMDVALLILKKVMYGNNIKTILLHNRYVPDGATVKVLGWGLTSENGYVSNNLRAVEVKKISKKSCKLFYGSELTKTMICATEPNKDSCNGDSGGPLVVNNRLAGIVSWGYGCATRYPGVYTNVANRQVNSFITDGVVKFA